VWQRNTDPVLCLSFQKNSCFLRLWLIHGFCTGAEISYSWVNGFEAEYCYEWLCSEQSLSRELPTFTSFYSTLKQKGIVGKRLLAYRSRRSSFTKPAKAKYEIMMGATT
jgi:hypothetical protein